MSVKKKKLYAVLSSMKQRCNNPKNKDYHRYGQLGIKVCEEWNNFIDFEKWALKNGYRDGLEIERIQNNKGYSPENCIFADRFTQNQNKGTYKNNQLGLSGISKSGKKYRVRMQVNKESVYLGTFSYINDAIEARNNYILENNLKHKLNKKKDKL